jgi:hypothetical protein
MKRALSPDRTGVDDGVTDSAKQYPAFNDLSELHSEWRIVSKKRPNLAFAAEYLTQDFRPVDISNHIGHYHEASFFTFLGKGGVDEKAVGVDKKLQWKGVQMDIDTAAKAEEVNLYLEDGWKFRFFGKHFRDVIWLSKALPECEQPKNQSS